MGVTSGNGTATATSSNQNVEPIAVVGMGTVDHFLLVRCWLTFGKQDADGLEEHEHLLNFGIYSKQKDPGGLNSIRITST